MPLIFPCCICVVGCWLLHTDCELHSALECHYNQCLANDTVGLLFTMAARNSSWLKTGLWLEIWTGLYGSPPWEVWECFELNSFTQNLGEKSSTAVKSWPLLSSLWLRLILKYWLLRVFASPYSSFQPEVKCRRSPLPVKKKKEEEAGKPQKGCKINSTTANE